MKGFVISIDGIIALIIAFTMLLVITANFADSKYSSLSEVKLGLISEDILTVLEKSEKLEESVIENQNKEISKYLNKTSNNLCFELSVFDFDNNSSALSNVSKKGCTKTGSVISIKRSFFVSENEKFYWAEMRAWYKVK